MSNFAFGYQNGGGGVSDIKDAYTDENSGNAVVASDSPYTIVGTGSVRVLVDTSVGEVTINMPASSEAGDQIKIVDVGESAGTNKITIGSLGTIETDKGSREYRYDGSSFELMEAFKNILYRDADTGEIRSVEPDTLIANSVEAGTDALTDSEDYAGFVNIGTSLNSDGASYGNNLDFSNNFALDSNGATISKYGSFGDSNGSISDLIDGFSNTYYRASTDTPAFEIDFGQTRTYDTIRFYWNLFIYDNHPTQIRFSNYDGSWSEIQTVSYLDDDWADEEYLIQNLAESTGSKLRIEILDTESNYYAQLNEIQVYKESFVSSNNSIDTSFTQEDNVTSPSACDVYDENDTVISDGSKVNIQYSLDNGSSFLPGSPISLTAFKALGNIETTGGGIFQARLYPVDDQRISRFDRVGPSVKNDLDQNGSSLLVNAVAVHSVDTSGNIDFKGSAHALTEGANVAVDGSKGPNFTLQLDDENVTIDNPTNVRIGKKYSFQITQDDVAARTITWGSNFKFAGGTAETLTASVDAVDVFTFESFDGSTLVHVSSSKDIS